MPGSAKSATEKTTSDSSAGSGDAGDPLLKGPPAPSRAGKLLKFEQVRDFVSDALRTTTERANISGRLNPEEIPDLWLADVEDDAELVPPVARIIHRRLPVGADELGNPDLNDAIEALFALWFYARKQFARLRDWRRAKRDLNIDPEGKPDDEAA